MSIVDFPSQGTIGTSLKPQRFDIEVYQGDTFRFYLAFAGTALDVTGWTASGTVKKSSDNTVVPSILTASAVDTVNKRFLITIESDTLDSTSEYKYDIQVVNGSEKRTFIGGKITVTEDITEP